MRTSVSPSGTIGSSFCRSRPARSCSCVTIPSDMSASPMRAMGVRLWASSAFSNCSGMTTSLMDMGDVLLLDFVHGS